MSNCLTFLYSVGGILGEMKQFTPVNSFPDISVVVCLREIREKLSKTSTLALANSAASMTSFRACDFRLHTPFHVIIKLTHSVHVVAKWKRCRVCACGFHAE